ncbi:MAG: PH domain-containing protein [Candidatus Saccharibacteria bacterium]|jgi:hypothetical protein
MKKQTKRDRASRKSVAGQHADEQIILVEHQHPVVMRRQLIYGMLILLVAILPWAYAVGNDYSWAGYTYWFLLGALLILGFYWLRTWVGWYYSVYVLSNTRIMVVRQRGFFGREVSELALNNVQSVNYNIRGAQASMLGYGNVVVETLSGSKPLRLRMVHKPAKLQQSILEVLRRTE